MQRMPCGVRFATADVVDVLAKTALSSRETTMAKCRAIGLLRRSERVHLLDWSRE